MNPKLYNTLRQCYSIYRLLYSTNSKFYFILTKYRLNHWYFHRLRKVLIKEYHCFDCTAAIEVPLSRFCFCFLIASFCARLFSNLDFDRVFLLIGFSSPSESLSPPSCFVSSLCYFNLCCSVSSLIFYSDFSRFCF